jgi:hypothetical protein
MKVNRPDSTCGRKASCCALLKRCTSSTKTTVARPWRAAPAPARRPRGCPSRPASTADSTMKCAPVRRPAAAPAWSCPRPAGPRGSSTAAGRLEGHAQRLARAPAGALARHLVQRARPQALGQRRGRATGAGGAAVRASNRFLGAAPAGGESSNSRCPAPWPGVLRGPRYCSMTSAPGGGTKRKRSAGTAALASKRARSPAASAGRSCRDLDRRQLAPAEAHAQALEGAVARLGRGQHPLPGPRPPARREREVRLQRCRRPAAPPAWRPAPAPAGASSPGSGRRRRSRPSAVGHDGLLEGLGVDEAEAVRAAGTRTAAARAPALRRRAR